MNFFEFAGQLDFRRFYFLAFLRGKCEMLRSHMRNSWSEGNKLALVLFFIEIEDCPKLFINIFVIAFFPFAFLNFFLNPKLKLSIVTILSPIHSEFKKFLAFPKLLRCQSEDLSISWLKMFLVGIIKLGVVFLPKSRISIFVQQKLRQVVIFKLKLPACRFVMIHRKQSCSKSMDYPFGLQLNFGKNNCSMGPLLIQHFILFIYSPNVVVCQIEIESWFVVYSAETPWNQVFLLMQSQILLCFFYSFEICRVLLLIDVEWVFIMCERESHERQKRARPTLRKHHRFNYDQTIFD